MSHVYIENLQSLDYDFKDRDTIQFICKNCGRDCKMLWKNYKKTKFSICSICKRESTMLGKYKGKTTLTSNLKDKVEKTNKLKYGQKTPAWKKRIHAYDDNTFNSVNELAMWIYCKGEGIPIEMMKESIYFEDWIFNTVFLVDGVSKIIVRNEEVFNIVPSEKLEEVLSFFKNNNIKVLFPKELKDYKKYTLNKHGNNFFATCRLK